MKRGDGLAARVRAVLAAAAASAVLGVAAAAATGFGTGLATGFGAALSVGAARAQDMPGPGEGARFRPALEAAAQKDWVNAERAAARLGDPAAAALIRWRRLSDGEGGWADYAGFIAEFPNWPGQSRLRRLAERQMPAGLHRDTVYDFFAKAAPETGTGALRFADALSRDGRVAEARDAAIRAWRDLSLTPSEQARFLRRYGGALSGQHEARLDMLLWRGLAGESMRMAPLVSAGWISLARARIALRKRKPGVNALIAAVPGALKSDPGLAYERFRWRAAKGLDAGAEDMLITASQSATTLGRPLRWASARRRFAHRAMREGRARTAYRIAARHGLSAGSDFAQLEWLAGWLALRKLNDPATALAHFQRFQGAVATPISLGRAGYWIGRAKEALGDQSGARAAYAMGAMHQTSFYGQLAAERIGAAPDPALAGGGPRPDWRRAPYLRGPLVRAGALAHWAGDPKLAHRLLTHAALVAPTPRDMAALGALALELDRPDIAVRVAKIAARKGVVLIDAYYPVTALGRFGAGVHPALAMSIARQETELNPLAISPVGARGLMQLMPATAKKVAKSLGLAYSRARLTEDWQYNARLGQSYLAGLIDEFGSEPMAAAGYNAGPHRVRRWLGAYGDPRVGQTDMVDWIETIPFSETRNYVMRVMEGLHVYHARLSGRVTPIRLSARLGG